MKDGRVQDLISILMDSQLYLTLPVAERKELITRLTADYPLLFGHDAAEGLGSACFGHDQNGPGLR